MNLKTILVLLLVSPLILKGQTNETGILRAGFARTDITPSEPVMLYGYASRKTPSEGVHDPLSVRIVAFESNGKRVLFISSDLGSYGTEVYKEIKARLTDKYRLKDSEIFLSTIHSHSSPILTLNRETGFPGNVRYTEWLAGKIVGTAGKALDNLQPVMTGTGAGSSPVGTNRRETRPDGTVTLGRDPYGITDKEVLVMKIASAEGEPLGTMFDYATHSTSLGARNLKISGDVLGLSAQFVEKILGEEFISPVFAGASGNIDPWYRVLSEFNEEPGWIPEPVLLGTLLGEEVVHVYRGIKEVHPGGGINTLFKTVECPEKKPAGGNANQPDLQNQTVPVNITAARIGDVAFIGFNVEMFTEIGMKIKESSPFRHTFVITHCNGSSGYLPPLELYKEGGYEITSTKFETGSAELVIREAVSLLHDL